MLSHHKNKRGRNFSSSTISTKTAWANNTDPVSLQWQKLIKYYASCISVENTSEITLYSSGDGKEFVQVPPMEKEWLSSGREKLDFECSNKKIQTFLNNSRWNKTPPSYFYGFPCSINPSKRKSLGKIIRPILVFGVELVQADPKYVFMLQSDRPRINSDFLMDRNIMTSIEMRKQVAESLLQAWDEEKDKETNLKAILNVFSDFLPQEVISFPVDILNNTTTELTDEEGILPIGIIFKSTESKYTIGLEQELTELRDSSTPNNVWRSIIDRDSETNQDLYNKESSNNTRAVISKSENSKNGDDPQSEILQITELNDEQRRAVKKSFTHRLTVVTGPPGTGKSQIILNIITSALLHNQSVLFASKNHKAVDVVIERLSRLQAEPIILKYGQNEREIEFAEALLSALERASNYSEESLEKKISTYKQELSTEHAKEKESQKLLFRILDRRNKISDLHATLESLRTELPPSISQNLHPYKKIKTSSEFDDSVNTLTRLIKEIDNGFSLASFILMLFGHTLKKRIILTAKNILRYAPIKNITLTINSIQDSQELLKICLVLQKWIYTQSEFLKIIEENENEIKIETLRENITESRQRALTIGIKYTDALMKRRLKSLSLKEKHDVADYVNVVRRLENDITGGEIAEKLRNERKRMFKSVARVFPAMAVTNLSVRHALPLSADVIDIVVIDEASQCDIASALPLLYRAKRSVIIGDQYQLSHISVLHSMDDQQLQKQHRLSTADDLRFTYSTNSLFDLAKSSIGSNSTFIHLLEHYRSRSEIIEFSNKEFYGGQLNVWTDYRKLPAIKSSTALEWHNITGEVIRPSYGSAYNLEEAKAVVTLIEEILNSNAASDDKNIISLGVVTPFREQANKIRALVEQKIDSSYLHKLDLTVDTAHKYQGDERNIMIFSPVVSHNIQQSAQIFLRNTKQLFNVAITRARSELHVVGDKIACIQSDVPYLVKFVQYINELKNFKSATKNHFTEKFESPWEKVFHDALLEKGIKTISQYTFNQYRLDLVVLDSKKQIDIEIDGEMWHRTIEGERVLSDLKRDQHLTMYGWHVKRFWVYQLQNNLEHCVQEIIEILKS